MSRHMGHHHSGRGVLVAAIALLVVTKGACSCARTARAGRESGAVSVARFTPSADGNHFLFLPAIAAPNPDPIQSTCSSEQPDLCTI